MYTPPPHLFTTQGSCVQCAIFVNTHIVPNTIPLKALVHHSCFIVGCAVYNMRLVFVHLCILFTFSVNFLAHVHMHCGFTVGRLLYTLYNCTIGPYWPDFTQFGPPSDYINLFFFFLGGGSIIPDPLITLLLTPFLFSLRSFFSRPSNHSASYIFLLLTPISFLPTP